MDTPPNSTDIHLGLGPLKICHENSGVSIILCHFPEVVDYKATQLSGSELPTRLFGTSNSHEDPNVITRKLWSRQRCFNVPILPTGHGGKVKHARTIFFENYFL